MPRPTLHTRLRLRPIRPDEAAAAVELQLTAFAPLTRAAWGDLDAAAMRTGMTEAFCAAETAAIDLDGVLIGWVRLSHHEDHDWLDLIVVAPKHQGRGLGGEVLGRLIAQAEARCVPLWLSVYRINEARRLYARLGFVTFERDPVRVLMGHPAGTPPPLQPPAMRQAPGPERSGEIH